MPRPDVRPMATSPDREAEALAPGKFLKLRDDPEQKIVGFCDGINFFGYGLKFQPRLRQDKG